MWGLTWRQRIILWNQFSPFFHWSEIKLRLLGFCGLYPLGHFTDLMYIF